MASCCTMMVTLPDTGGLSLLLVVGAVIFLVVVIVLYVVLRRRGHPLSVTVAFLLSLTPSPVYVVALWKVTAGHPPLMNGVIIPIAMGISVGCASFSCTG
jgi:LPXTG-motif cell wall-anchored protein